METSNLSCEKTLTLVTQHDPSSCLSLMIFRRQAFLQLELAAAVDWGEPFVKATYFLEGDGPLAVECYEAVQKVSEAVRVGHTPNVLAVVSRNCNVAALRSAESEIRIANYSNVPIFPA